VKSEQQEQTLTEEQQLHLNRLNLLQAIANNAAAIQDAEETIEEAQLHNRNLFKKLRVLSDQIQMFYESKKATNASPFESNA